MAAVMPEGIHAEMGDDHIMTVTINRPESRNSLDLEACASPPLAPCGCQQPEAVRGAAAPSPQPRPTDGRFAPNHRMQTPSYPRLSNAPRPTQSAAASC